MQEQGPPLGVGAYVVTKAWLACRKWQSGKVWRVFMRAQFDRPDRVPLYETTRRVEAIKHARDLERERRSDQDQRLGLAGIDLGIEMPEQLVQEFVLLLLVKIGLLDRAASVSGRAKAAPRRTGAELARRCIGVLEDFAGLEVEEFFVAGILQHQCLFPVANDDPVALADLQLGHEPYLLALGASRGKAAPPP
jgi:hypothetical protein